MKLYEISFLVKDEEGMKKVIDELGRFGAEIVFSGELESIKLAYPIRHLNSAYFGYLHFNLDPLKINDLNEALKLKAEFVRFLIVTPPIPSQEQRPRERLAKPVERPPFAERSNTLLSNEVLEEKLGEILGG
ncbi:MAG TPA: 30S ribosomal protein S6 [Candidatus Paceibacterota bacterium]